MTLATLIALGILLALYVAVTLRQVTARGPQLYALFLAGGGAMVLFGILTPEEALLSISFPVIAFLFSMFVFVAALDNAGVLSHLAEWLVSRGRDTAMIPFYLFVGFGLLSALLMNDALVLLGVPLVLALARRMGVSPVPLLLTIAYAVTVGSVMTPFGNPQNALIALSSGLSHPLVTFAAYLILPTVVNLLLCGWLLNRWFGPTLGTSAAAPGPPVPFFPRLSDGAGLRWLRKYPSAIVFPATLGVLIVGDVGAAVGLLPSEPIWAITLAGALILLIVQPTGRDLASRVDWSTLLLFVGLFVVMGGVFQAGLFGAIGGAFHIPTAAGGASPTAIGLVMGSSLLGSQVLSNVPWTALFIPLLQGLGYGAASPRVWMALAAGTTLAGNLTLLGAASNLIVVTQAEKAQVRIGFWEFMRYGIPLTLLTTGVVFAFLLVGL